MVLGTAAAASGDPIHAQTITAASLSGTVRGADGRPVPDAMVTMSGRAGAGAYRATTSSTGAFSIGLVQPGSYELRVEAFGYRPLVARPLTLTGGEERSVALTLTAEPPPVSRVDTIALPAGSSSRTRAGAIQFAGSEINGLPHRFNDLRGLGSLSTVFGRGIGSQGLPGDMTLVVADGVPVHRAPHPTARGELLSSPLFPTTSLASVASIHDATDVEWAGSAGGYLVATTRSATGGGGFELDAGWSGDPVWSSGELAGETPALMSYHGGARGTAAVGASSTLFVSGEAMQHEAPLTPRVDESQAASLGGLDAALLDDLTRPGVESYRRFSGLARLDVQPSSTSRIFFRGAAARAERSFDGAGPVSLAGLAAPAEESTEFSAALGIVNARSRRTTVELRAGVSGSYRDFVESAGGVPPAYLAESATVLGEAPSSVGESSRTDFVLTPVLRHQLPDIGWLKVGASVRATSHTMAHSRAALGDALFSGASQLSTGQGFGAETSAAEATFGTQEWGLFAQYEGAPTNNVRVTLGGRYDYERLPTGEATLNQGWFDATGIASDEFETGHHQFGARFSLGWDPQGTGRTRILIGGSLHEGDIDSRAVYQLLSQDGEGTSTRYSGGSLGWPEGGIPPLAAADLPSITLLGPDLRAPRTSNLSLVASQRVGDRTAVFVGGSTRRTDFLLRRRNLNLPLVPQATDPWGRPLSGSLEQVGGTVVTTADDARRFQDFAEVWALDPDGWSEYVGVTVGLEHATSFVETFAMYTWSETTDNWVGAASGSVGGSLEPGLGQDVDGAPWAEGISDFDRPHRAVGVLTLHLGAISASGSYRFESGAPFTPGYRLGVDANGDGSFENDVAFVPAGSGVDALDGDWPCLIGQIDTFAARNSCRGPARHTLDARIQFRLGSWAGREARLTLDGFNLIEANEAMLDHALLLVDPNGSISTSPDGGTVTIPTVVNPQFGQSLDHTGRGRMLRIGLSVGAR